MVHFKAAQPWLSQQGFRHVHKDRKFKGLIMSCWTYWLAAGSFAA
jgi:hypothetical protein